MMALRLRRLGRMAAMRRLGLLAALLVPFGLLHAFVMAEICIGVADGLFLLESARRRDFAWARQSWFILASIWWGWLVICSTPLPWPGFGTDGRTGFIEALVIFRLILFTAALQTWLLTTPRARRAAWAVLALAALWIGLESWQQGLTGHDLFGYPRWSDGALTGPFRKPRAGPLYAHLLFVAMLPPVLALLGQPGRMARLAGGALAVLGIATTVLIGQRMGVALAGLGIIAATFYVPRLRLPLAAALAVGLAIIIATPIVSPPTHSKLVAETERNFHHFAQSPYGEIFTVATNMGLQSPLHGWGYRGYRVDCLLPRFNTGLPALGIGPTHANMGACSPHPQNFYIQAFCDAGVPGLLLFSALMTLWMLRAGAGLYRQPDALRLGLLIGMLTFTWPLASTDEFPALYMLGWFFFLTGFGLACADTPSLSADAQHV